MYSLSSIISNLVLRMIIGNKSNAFGGACCFSLDMVQIGWTRNKKDKFKCMWYG